MYNYQNKGATFQAQRFTRYLFNDLFEFTNGKASDLTITGPELGEATCILEAKYGNITITEGDYVFPDSSGTEFYANPSDYFNAINEILPLNFEPPIE